MGQQDGSFVCTLLSKSSRATALMCEKVKESVNHSVVSNSATPWTVAH